MRAPDAVARGFLSAHNDVLGIDPTTLILDRQTQGNGHKHVLYHQTYKGIPVDLVSVKVHDAVYLTGLRVIEGKNGLFVAMPNRKTGNGEYQDIYFPASKAMRDELQGIVLEAYRRETEELKPSYTKEVALAA